jgi:hypothetical protein
MLKISLDEAYVFDLLSIYHVKLENTSNKIKYNSILNSFNNLSEEIRSQIGSTLFKTIMESDEYIQLKISNQKVFKLVDRAGESELSKITAEANYERYIKKNKLQNKFFKNELTEIKI